LRRHSPHLSPLKVNNSCTKKLKKKLLPMIFWTKEAFQFFAKLYHSFGQWLNRDALPSARHLGPSPISAPVSNDTLHPIRDWLPWEEEHQAFPPYVYSSRPSLGIPIPFSTDQRDSVLIFFLFFSQGFRPPSYPLI